MKLTKKRVEELALPEKGQRLIWDDDLPCFGVRLTSGSRTYVVQARVNGTARRVSLGSHGKITLDQAKKKAKETLASMLNGTDPVEEKKRAEVFAKTLRQIADDYLKDRKHLKANSREDINRHVDVNFSAWAKRPAMEITRDKVAVRFREISDRSLAQANQAFRILRALLNYARGAYRPGEKTIFVENPVDVLSDAKLWNHIRPKSGRIPTDKIGTAWAFVESLREAPEQTTVGRTAADIIGFLLFTGCRWSEAAELTWSNVNAEESWWRLEDPKNRQPVTFPLSGLARAILEGRPRTSDYVFPSRSGDGHIADVRDTLAKVASLRRGADNAA